ncbi:MAG: hypothetical protein SA339_04450 [Methanomassiliicoccus sp.]|nr:hypothetical protein [Methanomassiliicoccus sp.]
MDTSSFSREARAFVLDGDVSGLGVARSLGRVGIPLTVVDYSPSAGLSTRYGQGLLTASPRSEPASARDALMEEAAKLGEKGVIFPASDHWVQFVSQHRTALSAGFEIILPDERVCRGLTDKRFQQDEAERLGIPIARTFYPRTPGDVEELRDRLQYPVFVKPYAGHLWRVHFPNKGFRADGPEHLTSIFDRVFPTGLEAMVQEIVVGPNTNHFEVSVYIDKKGRTRGVFTAQKIRQYPIDFGMGTLVRSVRNEEVAALGVRLLEGMGYRGIADIEFKLDARDGTYKMLDINCRFWYQTVQATQAGINFPLIQYLDLTGQEIPETPEQRDGVGWLNGPSDLLSVIGRRGQLNPLTDVLQPWTKARCYSYYAWDDPRPAISRTFSRATFANLIFQAGGREV